MSESKNYPNEVVTQSKKGKTEVRKLIDYGKFVRYEYIDPETGKRSENKVKLVLLHKKGTEDYFLIPMKDNRMLMLPVNVKGNDDRMLWYGKKIVRLETIMDDDI